MGFGLTPLQLENCEVFLDSVFSRFLLQEMQFKSIKILLAESEAAVHGGLIIFLRTDFFEPSEIFSKFDFLSISTFSDSTAI